ncbi:MAG: Tm-1-like ATP-binding domain-containing protein, partial [Pseudomonadota bacterium]
GLSAEERRALVRDVAARLATAKGPAHVLMPRGGVEAWDVEGGAAHDPDALAAMVDEMARVVTAPVQLSMLDCHINDQAFADAALAVLDGWIADGTVPRPA